MLKSMTGYGRSELQNGDYSCKVEIRSVNNRFLEISTRLPKYLSQLEIPIKKLIKRSFARGSFDLAVNLEKAESANVDQEATPNLALATQYYQALKQIQEALGLEGKIELQSVLSLRDLIKLEPPKLDENKEEMILDSVRVALNGLRSMREEEGRTLQSDIQSRLQAISEQTESIKSRQKDILADYQNKIREKIQNLTQGMNLDESRLTQEAAILAERSDISEELTRLASHLSQFHHLLGQEEPLGRKLEFVIQEINRETNTVGSKTTDFKTSQSVIEIKSTLEKIREQLQNIE